MIISSYTFQWSVSDVDINKKLLFLEVYLQYKSISIFMSALMNND